MLSFGKGEEGSFLESPWKLEECIFSFYWWARLWEASSSGAQKAVGNSFECWEVSISRKCECLSRHLDNFARASMLHSESLVVHVRFAGPIERVFYPTRFCHNKQMQETSASHSGKSKPLPDPFAQRQPCTAARPSARVRFKWIQRSIITSHPFFTMWQVQQIFP